MTLTVTIVGLGYVGLPLAAEACRQDMKVVGFDTSTTVIQGLREGRSHIDDLTDLDVAEMRTSGFVITDDPADMAGSDVIVICVPTPLGGGGTPDLDAIISATEIIGSQIQRDCLVVLESTTYPGTTEEVVLPILEQRSGLIAGTEFALCYSPERTDPGNPVYGIRNTPKVIGGFTDKCTERAKDFYGQLVETVVPTVGTREAELAKLLENTYRHINIALMNEMSVFCHELGIDLWSAIEAAKTKPFGFHAFYPGPGVGGHCIPIDPNYLSWVVRSLGYRFQFVELAQEISDRMPGYVAKRIQNLLNASAKAVNGSNILLLGVTYKANIRDDRETPAKPLAAVLLDLGAEVCYFDPYVHLLQVGNVELRVEVDLNQAIQSADIVVLLQPHDQIMKDAQFSNAKSVFDTRGILTGDNVERL
jgi:nucleotide sugar dehydrogenase